MSRMGAESCRFSSRMDGKRMENRKQIRKAKLPTGIDDFQKIRTNNYYYVDKTAVIEQVLENGSEVTLFTRPRRFGKSLNMSMMQCFFEAGADASLFENLYISKNAELCEQYLGQYPVISISLKGIDARFLCAGACTDRKNHESGSQKISVPFGKYKINKY